MTSTSTTTTASSSLEPYALDRKISLRQSISLQRNTSNLTTAEQSFVDELIQEGNEEELESLLTTLQDSDLFFANQDSSVGLEVQLEPPISPGQRGSILRQQTIEKRRSCHQRNSLWRRSSMKKVDSFGTSTTNKQQDNGRSSSKAGGGLTSLFTLGELEELEASYDQDEPKDEKKEEELEVPIQNEEALLQKQKTQSPDKIKRASRNIYLGEGFEVGAEDLFEMYSDAKPDYDPWRDNLEMDEEGHVFDFSILGTSPDDVNATPHALSPPQMYALQKHLPMARKGESFWLKYSMVRDGASFAALLQHTRGSHHTVMCMETIEGEVFGAFVSTPWSIQPNYFGNGECFLWKMKSNRANVEGMSLYEQAHQESDIQVYPYSYRNNYYQLCQHDRIGLGGGMASTPQEIQGEMVEPSKLGFGIVFEGSNLLEASSAPCLTFASPSLSSIHADDGSRFELVNLEVWALTPCVTVEEARRLECQRLFLKRNMTV